MAVGVLARVHACAGFGSAEGHFWGWLVFGSRLRVPMPPQHNASASNCEYPNQGTIPMPCPVPLGPFRVFFLKRREGCQNILVVHPQEIS